MSGHSMMPVGDNPIIVIWDNPKSAIMPFGDKQ